MKMQKKLVSAALALFYEVRDVPGLKKKPSTSELLDWIRLLVENGIVDKELRKSIDGLDLPPLTGALIKNEQDGELLRQSYGSRRRRR